MDSQYLARNLQDTSTIERFWHLEARWPAREAEKMLLMRKTRKAASGLSALEHEAIVEALLQFAAKTRQTDETQTKKNPDLRAISPRVLIRFAEIFLTLVSQHAPVPDPVKTALAMAFANGCAPSESYALQQLAHFELAGLAAARKTA